MDLSQLGLRLQHTCVVVPDLDQGRRLYIMMGYYPYHEVSGDGWSSVFMYEPNTGDNRQLTEGDEAMPHEAYYGPDILRSKAMLIGIGRSLGFTVAEEELPGGKWQLTFDELPYWIELTPDLPVVDPEPLVYETELPHTREERFGHP